MTSQKQVQGIVSYEYKGKVVDTEVTFNLINGMIDENNPVRSKDFIFRGELTKKRIKLMIRDAFNRKKFDYFAKDKNSEPAYITII